MPTDPLFYLVGYTAIFMIAFGKGAFGGGLAVLGVPVLALVVDPVTAAIMMAPLVVVMDPIAIAAYPMRTWSMPDLAWMAPGILVGLLIGALFFFSVDPRIVSLGIAIVTLWFAARHFMQDRTIRPAPRPVEPVRAMAAATLSGFTTFIAHGGGPPISFYLLPRALPKTIYAGTYVALFFFSNIIKLGLYLWLGLREPKALLAAAVLVPAIPLGIWAGKQFHDRIDEEQLYFLLYLMLVIAGLKLLYDSVRALLG